ncbi:DUF6314 family protein [Tropicimonas sp. TH_r6]|uniref:DUF6314 family protein n=1 Tax=Tropicimonas sp. TH_r6 TaxID=3082085 RepID=UPI002954D825|nr:DUF6314 family protein [Tropicimonas sp. TH_r6]MDV7143922.1 DUF6314 family protein [Tropicimonas sp. TH_r6]
MTGETPTGLTDFEGSWQMEREIDDRRAGETLRLTGRAVLVRARGGLDYTEHGRLTLGDGQVVEAERRYHWRAEDGGVAVDFPDGRFFHAFALAGAPPLAHHFCDPDSYDVRYNFVDWPLWRARWRVTGPRKDYLMETRYRRE